MATYFTGEVASIGSDAEGLMAGGVAIFFAEPCPEALAEVAVVLRNHQVLDQRDPQPGDVLVLGDSSVTFTKVGEVAGENLRSIGHVVVYCNVGEDEKLLPGAIHATGELAVPAVGASLTISTGEAS